jgi:hypothetical protein
MRTLDCFDLIGLQKILGVRTPMTLFFFSLGEIGDFSLARIESCISEFDDTVLCLKWMVLIGPLGSFY